MFRKLLLIIIILVLAVSIPGCMQAKEETLDNSIEVDESVDYSTTVAEETKLMVVDDLGREVVLDKVPERIISLSPSHTEILFAIGLGDKVVGVTIFDDYPEEVLEIEKVSDLNGNNIERIIELEPDLILYYGSVNDIDNKRLDEEGIIYASFMPESIDGVIETIEKIGQLTGKNEEAKNLIDNIASKKEEIVNRVEGSIPKRVFYEVWHEPLMAAGHNSLMDELIRLANGENIAKDSAENYPLYDLHELVEENPQVYLTSADFPEKTAESVLKRPGYENIDAIINGNVYVLDSNFVSRPGPRIVQALELVAKAIHPEIFSR